MLLKRFQRLFSFSLLLIVASASTYSCIAKKAASASAGAPLTAEQAQAVSADLTLMQTQGLSEYAQLGLSLQKQGRWLAALPTDPYLAASEKSGDTPFAYTLPDDGHPKQPVAIVLAPRFFTDADAAAQSATMIHEMGHWKAFVQTGASTEYDGYKAEFDTHKQLGLTDKDGLTYFMMLDGVDQNVVPKDKSYADQPEVKSYLAQSSGS